MATRRRPVAKKKKAPAKPPTKPAKKTPELVLEELLNLYTSRRDDITQNVCSTGQKLIRDLVTSAAASLGRPMPLPDMCGRVNITNIVALPGFNRHRASSYVLKAFDAATGKELPYKVELAMGLEDGGY